MAITTSLTIARPSTFMHPLKNVRHRSPLASIGSRAYSRRLLKTGALNEGKVRPASWPDNGYGIARSEE